MLFSDYQQRVILAYRSERNKGTLSLNLLEPTPASLRNECLIVYSNRYLKKDENTLKLFFNFNNESNDYSKAIERYDPDRLKPLVNFLLEKTANTDKKNIELLAWLIDYEQRPYKYGQPAADTTSNQETETNRPEGNKSKGGDTDGSKETGTDDKKNLQSRVVKPKGNFLTRTWPVALLFALATSGIYWINSGYGASSKAYICDQGTGKKYHLSSKCPSLKNCKNNYAQTTVADAEKNGKTLCKFELK